MARTKVRGKGKLRLSAERQRKHRMRRSRDSPIPISRDTNVSIVNSSTPWGTEVSLFNLSDASSSSAPQPILSDRDAAAAEVEDMDEDEQNKLLRMRIQKELISTIEWAETFQKETERLRFHLGRSWQYNSPNFSWKPDCGA